MGVRRLNKRGVRTSDIVHEAREKIVVVVLWYGQCVGMSFKQNTTN